MKKTKIVIISTMFLLPLIILGVVFCAFSHVATWKYCIDDFDEYKADFELVSKFCYDFTKDNPTTDNIYMFIYGSGDCSGEILYSYTKFEFNPISVPYEINESFKNITYAFKNKDAQLTAIEVYNDTVFFETHNGLYSVVNSKSKPNFVDRLHKGKSKKFDTNWYHVVKI